MFASIVRYASDAEARLSKALQALVPSYIEVGFYSLDRGHDRLRPITGEEFDELFLDDSDADALVYIEKGSRIYGMEVTEEEASYWAMVRFDPALTSEPLPEGLDLERLFRTTINQCRMENSLRGDITIHLL